MGGGSWSIARAKACVKSSPTCCFHGGGEAVLEMRLFGLADLQRDIFARAGFVDVEVMADDVPQYGIRLEPWSRPIVARRPL